MDTNNALIPGGGSDPDPYASTNRLAGVISAYDPQRQALEARRNTFAIGRKLFSNVSNQAQLDQANQAFRSMTGKPSPYQDHLYYQGFTDKALGQIGEAEQRLAMSASKMFDPQKQLAAENLRGQIQEREMKRRDADQKLADAAEKKRVAVSDAESQAGVVQDKIREALGLVGMTTAGFGSLLADVPMSDARALRSALKTIQARLGFDEITKMRAVSPTGGALGQVTEKELDFLQSAVSNLDQGLSPDALKKNLTQINEHYQNWLDKVRKANSGAGGSAPKGPTQSATVGDGTATRRPLTSFYSK